eukprot:TRINITY_DN6864_c0_g1_i10.p1 TRINITY_DN6864_c0_g1~~TRINITY_DN6864_c0_g1_i10.p1  ORF type:complete len:865 (+),score=165.43 TRINITY_DN6864_c0_g1_i10:45-2639(+)
MGIDGLHSFLESASALRSVPFPSNRSQETKSVLVIDGANFVMSLYTRASISLFPDVIKLHYDIISFLEQLRERNIECHIFFDGVSGDDKAKTGILRLRKRWRVARKYFERIAAKTYPTVSGDLTSPYKSITLCPTNIKSLFLSALYEYGRKHPIAFSQVDPAFLYRELDLCPPTSTAQPTVKVFHTHGECDEVMAVHASKIQNCIGVLSEDSDMLMMPIKAMISTSFIKRHPTAAPTLRQASGYDAQSVARILDINPQHFPILGVLSGNDYSQAFKKMLPKKIGDSKSNKKDIVMRAASYLSPLKHRTMNEIIDDLTENRPAMKESFLTNIRKYTNPSLVDYSSACREIGIPDASMENEFWTSFHMFFIDNSTLSLILRREIEDNQVLMDPTYNPAKLLQSLKKLKVAAWFGHFQEIPIISHSTVDANMEPAMEKLVVTPEERDIIYMKPILKIDAQSSREGLHFLLRTLTIASDFFIDNIPPQMYVSAFVLRYFTFQARQFQFTEMEFDCLLLGAILLFLRSAGRVRVQMPDITERSLRLSSLYNVAVMDVVDLFKIYGLPGGLGAISYITIYEANTIFTVLSPRFQTECRNAFSGRKTHRPFWGLKRLLAGPAGSVYRKKTVRQLHQELKRTICDGLFVRFHRYHQKPANVLSVPTAPILPSRNQPILSSGQEDSIPGRSLLLSLDPASPLSLGFGFFAGNQPRSIVRATNPYKRDQASNPPAKSVQVSQQLLDVELPLMPHEYPPANPLAKPDQTRKPTPANPQPTPADRQSQGLPLIPPENNPTRPEKKDSIRIVSRVPSDRSHFKRPYPGWRQSRMTSYEQPPKRAKPIIEAQPTAVDEWGSQPSTGAALDTYSRQDFF